MGRRGDGDDEGTDEEIGRRWEGDLRGCGKCWEETGRSLEGVGRE